MDVAIRLMHILLHTFKKFKTTQDRHSLKTQNIKIPKILTSKDSLSDPFQKSSESTKNPVELLSGIFGELNPQLAPAGRRLLKRARKRAWCPHVPLPQRIFLNHRILGSSAAIS